MDLTPDFKIHFDDKRLKDDKSFAVSKDNMGRDRSSNVLQRFIRKCLRKCECLPVGGSVDTFS